jgi:antitoxin component of MazEF toxin-antitoxin module
MALAAWRTTPRKSTMSQQKIIMVEGTAMLPLPADIIYALNVRAGDTVELSVFEQQLRVVPFAHADRSARLDVIIDDIFARRREAYEQLAEGP